MIRPAFTLSRRGIGGNLRSEVDHGHDRVAHRGLADFVRGEVSAGRYESSSDVVRAALRLLERAERQALETLGASRKAWQDGIASGDAGELDLAR